MADASFTSRLKRLGLPETLADYEASLYRPLMQWVMSCSPRVLGVQGTQGSGKSTLATVLQSLLLSKGVRAAILSLDDLYLTRPARQRLACEVHPLLATRGVPGTHDMELGERILHWVKTGQGSLALPRFDKALDDRCPPEQWTPLSDPPDLLIFEGWCLGVPAQSEHALTQPVNRLEAEEDPDGRWRFYVNERLHTYEKRLFSALDALIVLQAPSFDQVFHWRRKQEEALRQRRQGAGVMSDAELQRFIQHYERLTRHALDVLPGRADVLIPLSAGQQPGKPQWHSDGVRADG